MWPRAPRVIASGQLMWLRDRWGSAWTLAGMAIPLANRAQSDSNQVCLRRRYAPILSQLPNCAALTIKAFPAPFATS